MADPKDKKKGEKPSFEQDVRDADTTGKISRMAAKLAEIDAKISGLKEERKELEEKFWTQVQKFKNSEEGQAALGDFQKE